MCGFKNLLMMLNLNNFLWLKSNQVYFKKTKYFPAVTREGDLYKNEKICSYRSIDLTATHHKRNIGRRQSMIKVFQKLLKNYDSKVSLIVILGTKVWLAVVAQLYFLLHFPPMQQTLKIVWFMNHLNASSLAPLL